jgi:diguanylate cyclase (GGDEF)-like protein/PAS domain S-box-containing protein
MMFNSDENLVEFLPLSTACVDASGIYRRVNRAYELACGVSRHRLVGQHFKQVLSIWLAEDQCQAAVRNLEIALAGTRAGFDTVLWAENGIHHVELSYTPVLDSEGSVAGVVEIIDDVTRFKLAEERMVKELRRIELIVETTSSYVFILDHEWRFTYVNRSAKAVLGDGQELLGMLIWDAFPVPDRPALESHYTRLLEERTHHVSPMYHREPLNRWFEHRLYPTQDGLIGYLRDITDRRTADEAVRLHQQAIASVPVGISIARYDPQSDFPLVYANPAFEQITGYSVASVIGKNLRFLHGPDTDQSSLAEVRRAIHEGKPLKVVLRNYRQDGSEFLNELQLSPVHNEEGDLTHLVGIQNDVTELIESRERLARQAHYDALTKVANRYHFIDLLNYSLKLARRQSQKVAVIYLDMDDLKQVNDTLGHHGGDMLLKHTAERIGSAVRETDLIGRLGGDEFALFCTGYSNDDEVEGLIKRIFTSLSVPLRLEGREFVVTVSAGYSMFPNDAGDSQELLRLADLAMYSAKKAGKNFWRKYHVSLESSAHQADKQ